MIRIDARLPIAAMMLAALLTAAPLSAGAQDAQADAPQNAVGDWKLRLWNGLQWLTTTVAVDAAGMRVEEATTGDINYYDPHLSLYKIETAYWTFHYEPSDMRYAFPLYLGKHWEGVFSVRSERPDGTIGLSYETAYECEVACIEHVTVPAGEFDAFKISCDHTDLDDNDRLRETCWFAPAVGGSVKYVGYKFELDSGWIQSEEMTLLGFEQARKIEFDVLPDGVESTCSATTSMTELNTLAQD